MTMVALPELRQAAARLAILQPDALCREGLSRLVRDFPQVRLAAAAARGTQLLEAARSEAPDLVLMEVDLPGEDGLEVIGALGRLPRPPRVVVLSRQAGHAYVTAAFARGASGYLPRTAEPHEVWEALRAVLAGRRYVHPSLAAALLDRRLGAARDAELTERECSVLIHLGRGATNQEIARHLFLSEKTVRNSLTRLFHRLGARNRLEAVALARELGYL